MSEGKFDVEFELARLGRLLSHDPQMDPHPSPDGRLTGSWDEFREFLDVGEYELAWDTLFEIANRQGVSGDFWSQMTLTAARMGLEEKAKRAGERTH